MGMGDLRALDLGFCQLLKSLHSLLMSLILALHRRQLLERPIHNPLQFLLKLHLINSRSPTTLLRVASSSVYLVALAYLLRLFLKSV